jgi:hypothetical protein
MGIFNSPLCRKRGMMGGCSRMSQAAMEGNQVPLSSLRLRRNGVLVGRLRMGNGYEDAGKEGQQKRTA